MKKTDSNNSGLILIALLIVIPIVVAIVYFKMNADESNLSVSGEIHSEQVAIPDTTVYGDAFSATEDTIMSNIDVSVDQRSAAEAGEEDGYWDGWYDAAETGTSTRYDENSNYKSKSDRESYATSYRLGYKEGFEKAKLNDKEEML